MAEPEDPAKKNFFTEIVTSISDACFSKNGKYIFSRDFLTVKVKINIEINRFGMLQWLINLYVQCKYLNLWSQNYVICMKMNASSINLAYNQFQIQIVLWQETLIQLSI